MHNSLVRTAFLALMLSGGVAPALVVSTMPAVAAELGLKERRALKAYEDSVYPGQLKAIEGAAGFAVPVEPKWDNFGLADQAENYSQDWFLTDVYFKPLVKALTAVASDDMGKKALQEKLKKIVLKYDEATAPASAYADGVTFADGVLTLNFKPGSNAQDIDARAKAIEDVVSAKL